MGVFLQAGSIQSKKLSQVVLDNGLARLVDQLTFHLIVDDPLTINRLHRCNRYSPVLRWSVSYSLHLSTFETPSPKSTQKKVGTTLLRGTTMLKRNRQEEQSMLQLLTKELRSIDLLALLIGVRYQPEIAYTMYSSFSVRLSRGSRSTTFLKEVLSYRRYLLCHLLSSQWHVLTFRGKTKVDLF